MMRHTKSHIFALKDKREGHLNNEKFKNKKTTISNA